MLQNFNPSFVLDLTATPKKESNIISFVDARQLKAENMVKLPVIVYNRKSQEDVFISAVSLRRKLELEAVQGQKTAVNIFVLLYCFRHSLKTMLTVQHMRRLSIL